LLPDILDIDVDDPSIDAASLDEFDAHLDLCQDCKAVFDFALRIEDVLEEKAEEIFCGKVPNHLINAAIKILTNKAEAYQKEGKHEEAIKCYQEALELRPGDGDVERKLIELIQTNSGDPLRRNFVVRVNDKITEYEIIENELSFYLYKTVDEIEEKNVTITKDDEIYSSRSFSQKDIRIYQLAADTGKAKEKKSKARIIKGVDFKRKPYRKINYRTYINPREGYAKVIIELPS